MKLRIREVRRQKGLTQTALAKLISKTQGLVGKYERGDVRIPADTLWSIAEALGVPIAQLFEGQGNGSRETVLTRRRRLSSTGEKGASGPSNG
jgi:transcriptional regulator with XRE-family HTH domain